MIKGTEWDLRIGIINEVMPEKREPILLFDQIEEYPQFFELSPISFTVRIFKRLPCACLKSRSSSNAW